MNFPTVIVLVLLLVWLYFALRHTVLLGKSGGCASCGGACQCANEKKASKAKGSGAHTCSGACASCKAGCLYKMKH